ncbi:MAG TPA: copper chaperone PCu(A)C [Pseudolabrys sp.]|nr:copper chaperone PCu(A)C [Pseudolabrys sp.]
MPRVPFFVIVMLFTLLIAPARADDIKVGNLQITGTWARATPKGAPVGGAYMKITNNGTTPDKLVGGTSDFAGKVEAHEMSMDGGVMRMRPTGGIEIKPGQTVELKPGGLHLMFVGLKKPFVQGDHVKATLNFEKAGSVDVDFAVQGVGAASGGGKMQDMHMH